jgi:hypothetical protein
MHYVKVKVRVHRYTNGRLAVFHGKENWPTMMQTGYYLIQKRMPQRRSSARGHTGKSPSGLIASGAFKS